MTKWKTEKNGRRRGSEESFYEGDAPDRGLEVKEQDDCVVTGELDNGEPCGAPIEETATGEPEEAPENGRYALLPDLLKEADGKVGDFRKTVNEELNQAIEKLIMLRDETLKDLNGWRSELYLQEFKNLAEFVQLFYRNLDGFDQALEEDGLAKDSACANTFERLKEYAWTLQYACIDLGLSFDRPAEGDAFDKNRHSSDEEQSVPEEAIIERCVAPGITRTAGGKTKIMKKPVVRVKEVLGDE